MDPAKNTSEAAAYSAKIAASDNLLESYKSLAEVYKNAGNPVQSLRYFMLYSNLKDSLAKIENSEKYSAVKSLYELDKRELDNIKLENE
ncbi:MAG: hypothetical protein R2759_19570 [Bacteroidales bacterium]